MNIIYTAHSCHEIASRQSTRGFDRPASRGLVHGSVTPVDATALSNYRLHSRIKRATTGFGLFAHRLINYMDLYARGLTGLWEIHGNL